jgi:hypothetical protein
MIPVTFDNFGHLMSKKLSSIGIWNIVWKTVEFIHNFVILTNSFQPVEIFVDHVDINWKFLMLTSTPVEVQR